MIYSEKTIIQIEAGYAVPNSLTFIKQTAICSSFNDQDSCEEIRSSSGEEMISESFDTTVRHALAYFAVIALRLTIRFLDSQRRGILF